MAPTPALSGQIRSLSITCGSRGLSEPYDVEVAADHTARSRKISGCTLRDALNRYRPAV